MYTILTIVVFIALPIFIVWMVKDYKKQQELAKQKRNALAMQMQEMVDNGDMTKGEMFKALLDYDNAVGQRNASTAIAWATIMARWIK